MKFFCEYCGVRINTDKDDKCPACGASYKNNKTFIRMQEEQIKEKEEQTRRREDVERFVKKTFKRAGIVRTIIGIIFVIVFGAIVFGMISMITSQNFEPKNEKKLPTFVETNVYSETSDYKVKVTGYESVEDIYKKAREGYEIVRFDLIVENKTDKNLILEDVNCIVNGVAQTNNFSSGYSTIPMFISPNLTVKGEATFIVPVNATSYDIRYGDNITIHIEK